MGFPGGSDGKESDYNSGELDSIPGSVRKPWKRKWQPTPVFFMFACVKAMTLRSCPTLCDPRDQPARLLCPWISPVKNTGVSCHFLFQGIFWTQGLNPCLLYWQVDSLPLSHLGSLYKCLLRFQFNYTQGQKRYLLNNLGSGVSIIHLTICYT